MYRLSGTSALATGESNRFPVRNRRFLGDNKAKRFPASVPLELRHGDNPIDGMAIDLYQAQARPMASSAAKSLSLRSYRTTRALERAILATTVPPLAWKGGYHALQLLPLLPTTSPCNGISGEPSSASVVAPIHPRTTGRMERD
jgi:hypothetical protein